MAPADETSGASGSEVWRAGFERTLEFTQFPKRALKAHVGRGGGAKPQLQAVLTPRPAVPLDPHIYPNSTAVTFCTWLQGDGRWPFVDIIYATTTF